MVSSTLKLKAVDEQIVTELERSRETLSPLLAEREEIVREAFASRPDSQGDLILEYATRKAPESFTPSDVFIYLHGVLGDAVTLNLVTAWLSKLVRVGKLQRRKRGIYELA